VLFRFAFASVVVSSVVFSISSLVPPADAFALVARRRSTGTIVDVFFPYLLSFEENVPERTTPRRWCCLSVKLLERLVGAAAFASDDGEALIVCLSSVAPFSMRSLSFYISRGDE
jgi:hypothetical protein